MLSQEGKLRDYIVSTMAALDPLKDRHPTRDIDFSTCSAYSNLYFQPSAPDMHVHAYTHNINNLKVHVHIHVPSMVSTQICCHLCIHLIHLAPVVHVFKPHLWPHL